jgi:hypothetical protein
MSANLLRCVSALIMQIGRAAAECMHARLTESSAQSLGKQTGACGERAARSLSKGQGYRAHVLGADCLPVQQRACSSCSCCVLERRGTCGHDAMASERKRERARNLHGESRTAQSNDKIACWPPGTSGLRQAMHAGTARNIIPWAPCHERNELEA